MRVHSTIFPVTILAFFLLLLVSPVWGQEEGEATSDTESASGRTDDKSDTPILVLEEERLFRDKIFTLSLKKAQKAQTSKYKYHFGLKVEGSTDTMSFSVDEIGLQKERLEIFMYKFYQAFFKDIYPAETKTNSITIQLDNPSSLTFMEKEKIEKELVELQTDREFDTSELENSIDVLVQKLSSAEERQVIETLRNQLIAHNQDAHQQLRLDLREMLTNFLQEATGNENQRSTGISDSPSGAKVSLVNAYKTYNDFLHRKSVEIGRQIYSLAVKAVTLPNSDHEYYVFELNRGTRAQYFEIEDLKANAHTISIMVHKMRDALEQLRLRSNQLPDSDRQSIIAIANLLAIDNDALNSQDREFLRTSIRKAAGQYGFDAKKLRKELEETGLIEAVNGSDNNARAATRPAPVIPVDAWINEAAVNYTEFIDNLDTELRNIASDFLFVAYVNSIKPETSELQIGSIKANEEINLYRKDLTYGNDDIFRPTGKVKNDHYPVAKVKVNEVRIEFENEQINNIEVIATKQGEPDNILAIQPDQQYVYVGVAGQIFEIPIWEEGFKGLVQGDANNTNFSVKLFDPQNGYLGLLTLNINDFKTNFEEKVAETNKRRNKAAEKEIKEISFNFHLILATPKPDDEPHGYYEGPDYWETYIQKFMIDDQPKTFEVAIYLDQEGKQLLKNYGVVRPLFIFGQLNKDVTYGTNKKHLEFIMDGIEWDIARGSLVYSDLFSKYNPENDVIPDPSQEGNSLKITIPIHETKFSANTEDNLATDVIPNGSKLIFQNHFPISYSTKGDVTFYLIGKKKKLSRPLFTNDNLHFIELNEAITNKINFYNNTENYSPRNSTIVIKNVNEPTPIYKEAATEILKAKIFSDFQGFDEANPNGLVQTEVSKRFFLNTSSTSFLGNFMYDGYMNYIEPQLTLSKLEEQNKYLPLRSGIAVETGSIGDTAMVNYVSSLDILNYSNLSIGTALGLAYYGVPTLHLRFQLGFGAYIHQSGFSTTSSSFDTITNRSILTTNEFNGNSLVYFPEFRMEFNPDPRFGLHLAWRPTVVSLLSNNVVQVDNEPDFLVNQMVSNKRKMVHQIQLFAFVQVNEDTNGEFFMRTNFNLAGDDRNNNFLQVQLGYAFNIFARDKAQDKATASGNGEIASQ